MILLLLFSAAGLRAQNCESFDGFINCGENLFDCAADGLCSGAFNSPGWINATGDDIDWSVSNIPTLSFGTGPDSDHTSGTGKFLFIEASECSNLAAVALTPNYNLSGLANPELQFWYHMHGLDMGTLEVEIESPAGSGAWTSIWTKSGTQGNKWFLSIVSLSSYSNNTVRFRFTGTTGNSFESDMALDDVCVASGCSMNCDDGSACTEDFCYKNACLNQMKLCDDGDLCTVDTCINGACSNAPLNCDDGDACTFDYCFAGDCFSDPPCDDFDACTVDSCAGQGNCINTAITCNDNNPCSFDYCDFGICYYDLLCDDFDACTIDSCDGTGNCLSTPVACNDGITCTIDECISGICSYVFSCNDSDPCTIEECVNDSCTYSPAPVCLCRQPGSPVGISAPTVVDSIIVTHQFGALLDLNVSLDINHTWIGDLRVELVSPAGTVVILFDGLCGNDADINAVFDDEGNALICPPSSFLAMQPGEPLSAFDGETMNGKWKLRVTDSFVETDNGILNAWCLLPALTPCINIAGCDDSDLCTNDACNNGACSNIQMNCDDFDSCTDDACMNGICQNILNGSCNVTISGIIRTETGVPVHTAIVSLTGNKISSDTTANDGIYSLEVLKGGSYAVTPSKNNDVATNNGISTADILFVRRHILAVAPLSSPQRIIAADVNASNTVSTADIVLIRRVVLQASDTFPTGLLWAFVPENHSFTDSLNPFPYPGNISYANINSPQLNQNFIAMKFGDVNNTWNPNTPKQSAIGNVQFAMDEQSAPPGGEVIVPVKVKDFHNITGYQFTLSWNPEVLELLGVNNKSIIGYYGMQKATEGLLTTTWDDEMARGVTLKDGDAVFELKFLATGSTGDSSEIWISSEMTVSEAYNDNLDLLEVRTTKGSIKVENNSSTINHHSTTANLSVQPNPFINSAEIIFSIPQDENVNLFIYDVLGRVIKLVDGDYAAGVHRIQWSGADDQGNALRKGLYHVKMIAGNLMLSSKAVIVR